MDNTDGVMIKINNFPGLSPQPQELDVLGSIKAPVCFYLNYANS